MHIAYSRGESVRTSKLTEARVRLIKARWRERPVDIPPARFHRLMGWLHGVSISAVANIVYGHNWGWVE